MKKTKENEINERGRKIKDLEKKIAKMQRTGRDLQDRNQKTINELCKQIKRLQADKNEQTMALEVDAVTEECDRLKSERDQLLTDKNKCSDEIQRLRSNLYDAETEVKRIQRKCDNLEISTYKLL